MPSTHNTAHQGDAAALREALRMALMALEAVIDGNEPAAYERVEIDGSIWLVGAIHSYAHGVLTGKEG